MTANLCTFGTDQPVLCVSAAANAPALLGDGVRELTGEELALIAGGYGWGDFRHDVGIVAGSRLAGAVSGGLAGAVVAGPVGFYVGATVGGNIGAALGVADVVRERHRH